MEVFVVVVGKPMRGRTSAIESFVMAFEESLITVQRNVLVYGICMRYDQVVPT